MAIDDVAVGCDASLVSTSVSETAVVSVVTVAKVLDFAVIVTVDVRTVVVDVIVVVNTAIADC